MMVYFDNAATTFPKPYMVQKAMNEAMQKYCANPGRGGHTMAYNTAEKIFESRKKVASLLSVPSIENIIFTNNCTMSLNYVIKGLAQKGGHFICSSLEHNAVARPLEALKQQNICTYDIAKVEKSSEETVKNFKKLINDNTIAIISTAASNVFGKIMPIKELSQLAHQNGLLFVVDAAQTAGIIPLDCTNDNIDFLCAPGHKGLYGPMGTGILAVNCSKKLNTIIEGGTGNFSAILSQPKEYPERLESGTLNVPGILGLSAGVDFVMAKTVNKIYKHEQEIITHIYDYLSEMKDVILYTNPKSSVESFVPLLSFNVKGLHSEETAEKLSASGVAVRAGFHCAAFAHKSYGTMDSGTVRICPSAFTDIKDMNLLLNSIRKIAKDK
ncbi:MAG: aminotransferase class V-fold PLP-dependent enzyme [Oscillospiraceae bacterium]